MPIYEYECAKCHNVFDEWFKHINDHDSPPCPECGGSTKRLMSNTSFALKGGGWYATEYGTLKESAASETPKSSDTTSPTSTASTEVKPSTPNDSSPTA